MPDDEDISDVGLLDSPRHILSRNERGAHRHPPLPQQPEPELSIEEVIDLGRTARQNHEELLQLAELYPTPRPEAEIPMTLGYCTLELMVRPAQPNRRRIIVVPPHERSFTKMRKARDAAKPPKERCKKIRYPTKAGAKKAQTYRQTLCSYRLFIYECAECKAWHLTKKRQGK